MPFGRSAIALSGTSSVEFCIDNPARLQANGFTEKSVLKKVAGRLLPAEIVAREKFGFVAQGSPFLLQKKIDWVEDLLSYERIKREGYFNPNTVAYLKKKYSQPGFTINPALEDDLLDHRADLWSVCRRISTPQPELSKL